MLLSNRFQPSLAPPRAHAAGRSAAAPVRVCAALKLGPYDFSTKDEARAHIRNILGYTNHDCMILPDTEDGEVLTSLVQRHPRAAEKIGCGISYFTTTRRWHDNVPTKHFVLYRTDGTSTDFSYLKCLKMVYTPPPYAQPAEEGAPYGPDSSSSSEGAAPSTAAYTRRSSAPGPYSSPSSSSSSSSSPGSSLQSADDEALPHRPSALAWQHPAATYRTALRNAVRAQTAAFKASAFEASALDPMFCPLAGLRLTLDNCRAVETPATPFLQLVDEWLQQQGCELQQVQVEFNPPRSGSDREWPVMSDPQQKFSWQEFYKARVQLQLVSHTGYSEMQNRKKAERLAGGSSSGSMGSSWQGNRHGHQQAADSSSGSPSSSPGSSPLQTADEALPLRLSPLTKRHPAATYRTALRAAVRSVTAAFKAAAFEASGREPMFCPGNGWQLTPDNCRAVETSDTPFSQLVEQWLQQQGCELEQVQLGFAPPRPGSNKEQPVMADPQQKLSWQEFYMAHGQLQLVSHAGFSRARRNNPEQRAGGSSAGSSWQGNRLGHQQAADSSSSASSSNSGLGSWQQAAANAAAAAPVAPAIRLRRITGSSSAGSSGSSGGDTAAGAAAAAASPAAGAERDDSSSHQGSSGADTAPAAVTRKISARGPPVQSTAATAAAAAAAAATSAAAADQVSEPAAGSDGVVDPVGEAVAAALSTASSAAADTSDESSSSSSVAEAPAAGRRRRRRL